MSVFWGSVVMVMLFGVALVGLILGSVAVHRQNTRSQLLKEPQLEQPTLVGGTPTVALVASNAAFQTPVIASGSNDSSGLIQGELLAASSGLAEFVVTFSKPFSVIPTSVTLTPANNPVSLQSFWVTSIAANRFTFSLTKVGTESTIAGAAQFYYLVL